MDASWNIWAAGTGFSGIQLSRMLGLLDWGSERKLSGRMRLMWFLLRILEEDRRISRKSVEGKFWDGGCLWCEECRTWVLFLRED